MPCDTYFLGHVARRYRWQQSFDPMTSLNLTFDAGQVKVRSRSGQIFKSIFLHKKHMFLAQNFLRIPNMLLVFFCTIRRTSEISSQKMASSISCYILQIPFSYGTLVLFVVIVFRSRVATK